MVVPPSTTRLCPVTKAPAGLASQGARNRQALPLGGTGDERGTALQIKETHSTLIPAWRMAKPHR